MYKEIAAVIKDDDFEMIELALNQPNIFRALAIERKEIRHSNFIGYILDPNQNHGLRDIVLKKLLRDLFFESKQTSRDIFDADIIDLKNVEIRREWRNIDLLIILEDDLIVIENKVDSSDHSNQLKRYEDIAKSAFPKINNIHYVYLTPHGDDPNDEKAKDVYINYSYEKISQIIESVLNVYRNSISEKIYFYLTDYLTTIRRDILMNENLNEIAIKVYNSHKEAFDFIFENKPDPASILYEHFESAAKSYGFRIASKNKGYIRFTTEAIEKRIPKNGTGWREKEMFLFEINYYWREGYAVFNVVIGPGDSVIQERIHEAVKQTKSYKTPAGKKWLVVYKHPFSFAASELIKEEEVTISNKITEIFKHVIPIAQEFSSAIESNLDPL